MFIHSVRVYEQLWRRTIAEISKCMSSKRFISVKFFLKTLKTFGLNDKEHKKGFFKKTKYLTESRKKWLGLHKMHIYFGTYGNTLCYFDTIVLSTQAKLAASEFIDCQILAQFNSIFIRFTHITKIRKLQICWTSVICSGHTKTSSVVEYSCARTIVIGSH